MAEEKEKPRYKLSFSDGSPADLGEISEEEAKEEARISRNNNPGVKLIKTTNESGGQEIDF